MWVSSSLAFGNYKGQEYQLYLITIHTVVVKSFICHQQRILETFTLTKLTTSQRTKGIYRDLEGLKHDGESL